jgi:hypothetical protein
MLAVPTVGFARSVHAHNVSLDVLADWIEANALLGDDDQLSGASLIDVLRDEQICDDQSMAADIIGNGWTELRRRQKCIGRAWPIGIAPGRITREQSWQNVPAHTFCILLALAKWYRGWARTFGNNYTEQGELFELLTQKSLESQFQGWRTHLTGWSRTHARKLDAVVEEIASLLGEARGSVKRWASPSANEAGLDLLLYRPFNDARVGIPVYLTQCASGGDWEGKLHTPRLEVWRKIIEFAAIPKKAFATPFSFLDDEFVRNCNLVDGLLLDRYRLLAAGDENPAWIPSDLRDRLIAWCQPRVSSLPSLNN